MFKSLTSRARTVATTGLIAAMVVAGVAVAQGGNGHSGKSNHRKAQSGKRMPPPPERAAGHIRQGPDLRPSSHVQHEGKAETIRIDAGEVISTASASSITVKENDGNEVTISVDDETKVLAGPGKETAVDRPEAGQHVTVCGPEGGRRRRSRLRPSPGRCRVAPRGRARAPGSRASWPAARPQDAPPQMQG